MAIGDTTPTPPWIDLDRIKEVAEELEAQGLDGETPCGRCGWRHGDYCETCERELGCGSVSERCTVQSCAERRFPEDGSIRIRPVQPRQGAEQAYSSKSVRRHAG